MQHIEAGLDSYSIENLEPFALYKISMSVQTRVGEGEISTPLFNRTAAGSTFPLYPSLFFFYIFNIIFYVY